MLKPNVIPILAGILLLLTAPASAGGLEVDLILESGEVNAGDVLRAGATIRNATNRDQLVLVEGYLAPAAEPIPIPPVTRWERFVYEVLAKITGDWEIIRVPAGATRAVRFDLEVHPRMHGRFEAVAIARGPNAKGLDRESVISKVTAPPSNGLVLVHGDLFRIGECRVLLTDDGHVYEPTGKKADEMYRLLDLLHPRPDGVTVLGAIEENNLGCIGVELGVDLFRFDREPGTPVGVRFRNLSRGRSAGPYGGKDEEIIRSAERLEKVLGALGAELTGRKPNFRKEVVALVTTAGTRLTSVRVRKIVEKDGTLRIHYVVANPCRGGPLPAELAVADVFSQPYHLVALPKFSGPVEFVRRNVKVPCATPATIAVAEPLDLPVPGESDKPLRRDEKERQRTTTRLSANQN